jgi:hypothetical protein
MKVEGLGVGCWVLGVGCWGVGDRMKFRTVVNGVLDYTQTHLVKGHRAIAIGDHSVW